MKANLWIALGAVLAGLGVALGAFGAHGLPEFLRERLTDEALVARRVENFETAVRYQVYHALALLAVGLLALRQPGAMLNTAGWCFVLGIAIFSGMLYALVLSEVRVLGAIVPIGGVALIVGWIALAVAAMRS